MLRWLGLTTMMSTYDMATSSAREIIIPGPHFNAVIREARQKTHWAIEPFRQAQPNDFVAPTLRKFHQVQMLDPQTNQQFAPANKTKLKPQLNPAQSNHPPAHNSL